MHAKTATEMIYSEESTKARSCLLQLIRTRMASRQAMQRFLKEIGAGITFEMLQIMSCLWKQQGISQQTLAERTAKDKACMTNLISNLEKKGYVYRMEDGNDRRNKLVCLTESGEEYRKWIAPKLDEYYRGIYDKLDKERLSETETLLKELQNVLDNH